MAVERIRQEGFGTLPRLRCCAAASASHCVKRDQKRSEAASASNLQDLVEIEHTGSFY